MSEANREVCWTVLFVGRVQGVGFRWTTRALADGFAVTGTVRNLPDGRVELVAEGVPSELERFMDAIRRHFGANISDSTRSEAPATGRFEGFGIAF